MPRHFEQVTAGMLNSRQIGAEAVLYGPGDEFSIRGKITRVDQERMVEADWNFNDTPKAFSQGSWRTRIWFRGFGSSVLVDYDAKVFLVSQEIDADEPLQGEVVEEQQEIEA